MLGQCHDLIGDGVANRLGAMTGKRGPVLDPWFDAMALHGRKPQQHCEASRALDEGADRRSVQTQDEVAFPVARNSSIFGLGGSFTDHDLRRDEPLSPPTRASPRHAQRSARPEARDELALQCAATLDIEGLVDRLV